MAEVFFLGEGGRAEEVSFSESCELTKKLDPEKKEEKKELDDEKILSPAAASGALGVSLTHSLPLCPPLFLSCLPPSLGEGAFLRRHLKSIRHARAFAAASRETSTQFESEGEEERERQRERETKRERRRERERETTRETFF